VIARAAAAVAAIAVIGGPAAADDLRREAKSVRELAPVEPARAGVYEDDRVDIAPAKKPIAAVAIDNPYGDLRIEGHDGPGLVILSSKRAPNDETLDRLRVSLIPDPDGSVRIVTAIDPEGPPVARADVHIDLVIRAPHGARVDGRVRDGRLELVNMDAGAELDTARGTIRVENVSGPVFARSLAGDQRFAEVFGTVDAQAVAADLTLDTVRGDRLIASTHDGRIDGRRLRSRRVELRTTRGDITYDGEVQAGSAITVASVRGSVDVRLRAPGAIRVRTFAPTVAVRGGHALGGGVFAFGGGPRPAEVQLRSRFGTVSFAVSDAP